MSNLIGWKVWNEPISFAEYKRQIKFKLRLGSSPLQAQWIKSNQISSRSKKGLTVNKASPPCTTSIFKLFFVPWETIMYTYFVLSVSYTLFWIISFCISDRRLCTSVLHPRISNDTTRTCLSTCPAVRTRLVPSLQGKYRPYKVSTVLTRLVPSLQG
jgi:hypothetical protein